MDLWNICLLFEKYYEIVRQHKILIQFDEREDVLLSKRLGFNKYKFLDDYGEFYIYNKKKEMFTVLVNKEDLERLILFDRRWNAAWREDSQSYYPMCSEYISTHVHNKTHYLHRWIFDYPKNTVIDHINHNTLDNRRCNLRLTEQKKNLEHRNGKNKNNKSGYRNVFWDSRKNKWTVHLCKDYHNIHVGDYDDLDEAGRVAEEARQKYYGKFAGHS